MPRAMRIRNTGWRLRAVSLLTLIALVVAPACAPLCAGRHCRLAEAAASADGNCHGTGAMPGKAPRAQASLACGSREMPAVVSMRSLLGDASAISRCSAPNGKFLAVRHENTATPAPLTDLYFHRPHDLSSRSAAALTGVLRI